MQTEIDPAPYPLVRVVHPDLRRRICQTHRRGQLQPVFGSPSGTSDLSLGGVVEDVLIRPAAFSSAGLAVEHEIRMTVTLDLARANAGEILWENQQIVLTERFLASTEPGAQQSYKEQAFERIAMELAGRVHDVLLQTF